MVEFSMNKLDELIEHLQDIKKDMGNCELKVRIEGDDKACITRIAGFAQPDENTIEIIVCRNEATLRRIHEIYRNQRRQ